MDPSDEELDRWLREFGLELPDVEGGADDDALPPRLDDLEDDWR